MGCWLANCCPVTLWVVQIQFILQIIINRIAIITTDKVLLKKIRITTIVFITLINISVFCIFIPGHLAINETFVTVNNIWDKVRSSQEHHDS